LDPFATGILLILTGKATKKSVEIMELEKEYLGVLELGRETDTCDIEGNIIKESIKKELVAIENIKDVLNCFIGTTEQIPPVYSALKYQGKPLYKYARKGIDVKIEPREVFIKDIQLLDYNWPDLKIQVTCSKGTYIRALARDVGRKLETFAYLKSLQRTRVGSYKIENAIELDDFLELPLDS
jgi:tRNA pseudouridine55 synthase